MDKLLALALPAVLATVADAQWKITDRPAWVWKITDRIPTPDVKPAPPPAPVVKSCPCSPLCVCGCQDGKPCTCPASVPTIQAPPVGLSPMTPTPAYIVQPFGGGESRANC